MSDNKYLLPQRLRPLGIFLLVAGALLGFARYYFNFKPHFLDLKVWALYSFYIESKINEIISNQMIEEIAQILVLTGLFMIAFTKEKVESSGVNEVRLKAFMITAYVNLAFLIVSLLVTFGFGFVGALVLFMNLWLLCYIVIFRVLMRKFRHL